MAEAVGRVLHAAHVVVPEGPDFDVSYSDPAVPFSVWVGVSRESGPLADLRLAEGLLHEAMHLQLSLIEDHVPLTASSARSLHSPWRNAPRPMQGVLHGTYVFTVVRAFMAALLDLGAVSAVERHHVDGRIATCTTEIAGAVASLRAAPGLTPVGREFVGFLAVRSRS